MATEWPTTPPSGVESSYNYTANTDVRDVSDILDALFLADTPMVNRLAWGKAGTNKVIEWVTDSIGYGYVTLSNGGTVASDASSFIIGTSGHGTIAAAAKQIHTGTVLKYNNDSDKSKGYMVVLAAPAASGTTTFNYMSGTAPGEALTDAATLFIIGSPVAEGSVPRADTTRPRALLSNKMQIFRKDVRITGTRAAIDMYAVANELRHQIQRRTEEYRRELERTVFLGKKDTGTSTETQTMGGFYDFLKGQSGAHIDTSTTTLTETTLNAVCAAIYDFGGMPTCLALGPSQARVIPTFERARVRVEQDSRVAGFYVNKYLTDLGVTLDIVISRWIPANFAFVLSEEKVNLRPLQGRRLILEKLGKKGDYTEYQLISELSMEFKGYTHGCHGMFTALT